MKTLVNTITKTINNDTMTTNTITKGLNTMKTQENIKEIKKNTGKMSEKAQFDTVEKSNCIVCGRMELNESNGKLRNNKFTRWLIFNILGKINCPWATPSCKAHCYAARDEVQYTNCREQRTRNDNAVKDADYNWITDVIAVVKRKLQKSRSILKALGILIIRIHEGGDFYSYRYFKMWMAVADAFIDDEQVVFSAYTKSILYIKQYIDEKSCTVDELPIHFVSSIWADTEPEMIELTRELGISTYAVGCRFNDDDEVCNCNTMSCNECRKCYIGVHHITTEVNNPAQKSADLRREKALLLKGTK